jgi:hypothetical protein
VFSILYVSFFDSPKNETQKSDPSVRASSSATRAPHQPVLARCARVAERIQTRPLCGLRQEFVLFVASAPRSRRRTAQGREVQHVNP